MKASVTVQGLDEARALVGGTFSQRNADNALSTALTRAAREIEGEWSGEIFSAIDRPTSFTARAVGVKTATAATLRAEVFIKDQPARAGAPAPVDWMAPLETGGGRYVKKFERALMAQGSMPAGMKAVPGRFARLDEYGNVSRSQITQVIAQLGQDFSPGYARTISANQAKRVASARRTGRAYVAFTRPVGKLKPGVYQRDGRKLLPVFVYVSRVQYSKRTDFTEIGRREAPTIVTRQVQRAIDEAILRKATRIRAGGAGQ